jgi:ArsR family transcriptional regulator
MKQTGLDALQHTFAALADPTRLRIVGLLLSGEVCVCHIHETLRIPQPKASRHLAYLRRSGLVTATKRGLWVHYALAEPRDAATADVLAAIKTSVNGLDSTRRDRARLQRTMCCVGPAADRAAHDVGASRGR